MLLNTLRAAVWTVALCAAGEPLVRKPFILLIGPPGSGKSTQAAAITKAYGVPVLSAEQMIRENQAVLKASRTPEISGMELRSDPALNRIFGGYLAKGGYAKGLIVDGYPATKDHCDYLLKLVKEQSVPVPIVLQLEVSDDEVRKRMAGQDNASMEQRIKDYHREMDMIRLYFPDADYSVIDAAKKEGAVTKEIEKVLKKKLAETK